MNKKKDQQRGQLTQTLKNKQKLRNKKNGPGGAIAMAGTAPIKKQINKNTNK